MVCPLPNTEFEAPRLLLVTAPDEETARRLAGLLVERRLAACCNLLPGITSVYRWEGEVQTESECLMLVKSTSGAVRDVHELLAAEHPYDTPECVALEPAAVEARYLAWWLGSTGGGA